MPVGGMVDAAAFFAIAWWFRLGVGGFWLAPFGFGGVNSRSACTG